MKTPSEAVRRMQQSGIREIFDLANTIPDAIRLEMGEPSFPTPAHIREAAAEAAERGHTKYTPNAGIPELREALTRKVKERNGIEATPEQIVVTPGAIASLYGVVRALCDPGDEILISDPAWPNYNMIGDLQQLVIRRYPLRPEDDMQPRPELIEPLISEKTKLIITNSPSNPTGAVIKESELARLLELVAAHDLWLVSDEVYDEIVFDQPSAPSAAAVGPAERVVSVFSFSKTYAMTGWRVGYAVAPRELVPYVVKTQEPITACVNAPAQMAALAAIEGPQACVAEMRDAYRTRRDGVVNLLAASGIPFVRPEGAFYVWIDVSGSGMGGDEFAKRLLLDRHVAVTPGRAFGPASDSFVRISLATAPEELYEGVGRVVGGIREWAG